MEDFERELKALGLPDRDDDALPRRASVKAGTDLVARALEEPSFVHDCLSRELTRLDAWDGTTGLSPFHVLEESGVHLTFGYFAPGQSTGAHEHTSWTITALCHNDLEVVTFDRDVAYADRRLVVDRTISATPGRVGHIYDPCIHEARNPSSSPSLTMHLLSPRDGLPPADKDFAFNDVWKAQGRGSAPPLPEAFVAMRTFRLRQSYLRILATFAAEKGTEARAPLLASIASRGSLRTRAHCESWLRPDPRPATRAWRDADVTLHARTPPLHARRHAAGVDLVCSSAQGERTLLRLAAWAGPILDAILDDRRFTPRRLPCRLDDDELFDLVSQMDEWGLLDWKGPLA